MPPSSAVSWALPLAVTVLFYGVAQGVYKQVALTTAQFYLLFVAAKTVLNWGSWAAFSRKAFTDRASRPFLMWALAGQICNGLAWFFYFRALEDPSSRAAIVGTITAAYGAVTVLLALIFLKERLVAVQFVGIGLVVGASMLLGYAGSGPDTASGTSTGWLVDSLLTMVFWGSAMTIFKKAYSMPEADDYRFFLTNWLGMMIVLLPAGMSHLSNEAWPTTLVALGLVIVSLYAIGDLTLFAAIARGPASVVSPLSCLYPIPTIAYSFLILKEAVLPLQWVAVAMTLVAIVLLLPEADNPVMRMFAKPTTVKEEPST